MSECENCQKVIKDSQQILINYRELMIRHSVLQDRTKQLEEVLGATITG